MRDLAELVRLHEGRVRRVLARRGVAPRDLADAQQEVFLVVHRKLAEFEGRASFSTWLHRIALNVASEHRRKARHRYEVMGMGDDASPACQPSESASADPHQWLEARELCAWLEQAVGALPPAQRTALVLHDVAELSMHEVARELGVPLKTAFSRVYAARRTLKQALDVRERGSRWCVLVSVGALLSALRARAFAMPARLAQLHVACIALACAVLGPVGSVEIGTPRAPDTAAAPEHAAARAPIERARPPALQLDATPRVRGERSAPTPRVRARAVARATSPVRAVVPVASVVLERPSNELIVIHSSAYDVGPQIEHPFAERLGYAAEPVRLAPRIVYTTGPRDVVDALEEGLGAAY